MLPTPLIGWLVAATGIVLVLAGALWAVRRSTIERSLLPARVVAPATDNGAHVEVITPTGPVGAALDRADSDLVEGDIVMVRSRAGHPPAYRPCPRPWNAYWLGLACYGIVLFLVGTTAALTGDARDELPLPIPFLGAFFLTGPFLVVGKVAGLVRFAQKATRVTGHIVRYRNHPHVFVNETRASMARVEYDLGGVTRRAWSRAAYMSSLFTGKRVTVWVGDRSPTDVMTVGTITFAAAAVAMVGGVLGAPFLLWSLL